MALCFILIFFIPVIDQTIKLWVKNNLCEFCVLDTFFPFLKITHLKNFGAAFGVFGNGRYFFIVISIIVILTLLYLLLIKKIRDKIFALAACFIIGGAAGNLIDRVLYGSVVDYLKVSFFPPVCNLSDYFISMGIILIFIYIFKNSDN